MCMRTGHDNDHRCKICCFCLLQTTTCIQHRLLRSHIFSLAPLHPSPLSLGGLLIHSTPCIYIRLPYSFLTLPPPPPPPPSSFAPSPQTLRLLGAVEADSEHPLGRAIYEVRFVALMRCGQLSATSVACTSSSRLRWWWGGFSAMVSLAQAYLRSSPFCSWRRSRGRVRTEKMRVPEG